jgi:hypothetical protein
MRSRVNNYVVLHIFVTSNKIITHIEMFKLIITCFKHVHNDNNVGRGIYYKLVLASSWFFFKKLGLGFF